MLTVAQAAQKLGISVRRVQALIQAGRIEATRMGRMWLIEPCALKPVRIRKPGRPALLSNSTK
jgi:excisionase family DNA binding protein